MSIFFLVEMSFRNFAFKKKCVFFLSIPYSIYFWFCFVGFGEEYSTCVETWSCRGKNLPDKHDGKFSTEGKVVRAATGVFFFLSESDETIIFTI